MWLEYLVDEKQLARMDEELAGWRDPPARLREALERDEIALYCQPILALVGPERFPLAEVLIRLREEEKAMLPPGEFLPVFEHYGMMPQLDRWVVRKVIERQAKGSKVRCFSINVSSQSLEDAQFPPFVIAALKSAGIGTERLVFEIDELDTLVRLEAARRFAAALESAGIGVAVDGFGRKSVSFMALKALRARYVKVDGSIVRKLLTSDVARVKMNSILRVGEALHMRVVAECVEEQDVLLRLKALGVQYAQGFGIYQPHPIDAIAAPAKKP
jgi:EAL domain-containing protein (putative c-di-GMP-specific phosphodiesterase class I)